MCMKNAQTKNALIVAITIAAGKAKSAGKFDLGQTADVTTVRIVKAINEPKTANNSFVDTG